MTIKKNTTRLPLPEVGSTVTTNYTDILSRSNPWFPYQNHFFQPIEIIARISGLYNLTSISNMNTYGCLYLNNFNLSSESTNKLLCNDDGIDRQFQLIYYLTAGVRYVLLFTTRGFDTGRYTVIASGPDYIKFTRIEVTERAPSIYEITTLGPKYIQTTYIHSLTNDSPTFNRHGNSTTSFNYYYQAIEITVDTTETYTLTSESFIDAYGYLYEGNFDPLNPLLNKIIEDDQSSEFNQFGFTVSLQTNLKYILVFTTAAENVTGQFIIVARGPKVVHFDLKQ